MPQANISPDGLIYFTDDAPAPQGDNPLRITVRPSDAKPNALQQIISSVGNDLTKFATGVRDAVTLPGDVAAGKFNVQPEVPGYVSDNDLARVNQANAEIFNRTNNLAGIVMGGGMPIAAATGAMKDAIGMAGGRAPIVNKGWLAPAYKLEGEVYSGKPGQSHSDVLDIIAKNRKWRQKFMDDDIAMDWGGTGWDTLDQGAGFVTPAGKFLTREQALKYADKNRQMTGADTESHDMGYLDTIDLADPKRKGAKLRSGSDEESIGPMIVQGSENAPVWHSAVENAVLSAKQEKGSPEQWMGMIKNSPGVKPEELQWLGLEDWLMQQKHPVSRDDIAEYLRSHRVEVKDALNTNHSELEGEPQLDAEVIIDQWDRLQQEKKKPEVKVEQEGNHFIISYDGSKAGTFGTKIAAENHVKDFEKAWATNDRDRLQDFAYDLESDSTPDIHETGRYAEHQLPGGENYGELLLHLPEKRSPAKEWDDLVQKAKESHGSIQEYINKASPEEKAKIETLRKASVKGLDNQNYQSSHWDEPNVLAHVRFNDRTINGKKTLFLEEVQSDWHQTGRKEGYKSDADEIFQKALDKGDVTIKQLPTGRWQVRSKKFGSSFNDMILPTEEKALEKAKEEFIGQHSLVPDAPFKKSWPDLTLKRMIRYAAENGYDQIAWTPGEVQSARWRGTGEEGHSKFYDEILVNAANKLGKTHGTKVEQVGVPGIAPDKELSGHDAMIAIGPELRDKLGIPHDPYKAADWWKENGSSFPSKGMKSVAEEAGIKDEKRYEHRVRDLVFAIAHKIEAERPTNIHTMPLTESMKNTSLRKGMPLFQSGVPIQPVTFDPFKTKDKNKDQERAPVSPVPKFRHDRAVQLMTSPFNPKTDWMGR